MSGSSFEFNLIVFATSILQCVHYSTVGGNNETERLALLEIKAQIRNDPMGVITSWNDTRHFCEWYGVTCSRKYEQVTKLDLPSSNLSVSKSPNYPSPVAVHRIAASPFTVSPPRRQPRRRALISRELKSEKMEKPSVSYGYAEKAKKGEDFYLVKTDCQRVPGNSASTFSVFAIFDGHHGNAAAIYARDNLLNHVLAAMPRELGRDEWLHALPRALGGQCLL
uniref:Leucine-rich repeat-containing N-terminal plant-type domain-containing protein n=1 Tax=Chenopodium quinoa TaxID=63459 RepID=A0A803MD93_CHEQI